MSTPDSATRPGRPNTANNRANRRACSRRDGAASTRSPSASDAPSTPKTANRRVSKRPLIEIGRAKTKHDALAGFERWQSRHPQAAAHLLPEDVLVDAMRGRFNTWTRIRVNLQHVPESLRPPQEPLDPHEANLSGWESRDPHS
jgi:hypothetical protein